MKTKGERKKSVLPRDENPYRILQSQLKYICRKNQIDEYQRQVLEKPYRELSCVLPIKGLNGGTKVLSGHAIVHRGPKKRILGGIIFDPGVYLDWLKAKALGVHLQARLLRIPFEFLLVGIKYREDFLSSFEQLKLEDSLQESIFSCLGSHNKLLRVKPFRTGDISGSYLSTKCLAKLIELIKAYKYPNKERIRITSDLGNDLTNGILKQLPEDKFAVLPTKNGYSQLVDVFILTEKKVSMLNARRIRTHTIIEGRNGIITPEAQLILAEREIEIIPDIVVSAPNLIQFYTEWLTHNSYCHLGRKEIQRKSLQLVTDLFRDVWSYSRENSISIKTSAYSLAVHRSIQTTDTQLKEVDKNFWSGSYAD